MIAARSLNVLVLAVGGNVSEGILKALRYAQLPCRVVGADVSPHQFGLYTTDTSYVGPWAKDPAFVPWLVELCRKETIDAVLSGAEPVLAVLAHHREAVEEATDATVIVSTPRVEAIASDKLRTCMWLKEHGFDTPAYAASEDVESLRALRDACGYPLVAKPRVGGGARGLFLVENDDDLAYAGRKTDYVVQECVGTEDREYTVGTFVDRDGQVRGAIVMRRELHAGTTYRAFVEAAPEVRTCAMAIAQALGPMGPCNIQMRLTDRGPVCFEINPRFSGTAPMRARLGFNEVEAALRHFVLDEADFELPTVESGVCLRYWNELYINPDAQAALETNGTLPAPRALPSALEQYGIE